MSLFKLAVLPFANHHSNTEFDFIANGITDEIITALSSIDSIAVISKTSSSYYKNSAKTLKEIAEELNVHLIIEGSVRIHSTQLKITTSLIQTENDMVLWSKTWKGFLSDVFALEESVCLAIADSVRELGNQIFFDETVIKFKTKNLEAYQNLLKGNYFVNQWNPDDTNRAIELFSKALEQDNQLVEAYIGLAEAYNFLSVTETESREEAGKLSYYYIQQAQKIDPNHASVQFQLANHTFFAECDFTASFKHTMKAIELNPNYSEALQHLSFLYALKNDFEKSAFYLKHALHIDPKNEQTQFYQAYYYYRKEQFDEALELLESILDKQNASIPAWVTKWYIFIQTGKAEQVLNELNKSEELGLTMQEKNGISLLAHIQLNHHEEVTTLMEDFVKESESSYAFIAHSYLFYALVIQGNLDEAFQLAKSGINAKSSILMLSLTDPLAKNVRKHAEFKSFVKGFYQTKDSIEHKKKKYQPWDEHTASKQFDKLTEFIIKEKVFLNPELNLRLVAGMINLNPNQLSWLINTKTGSNFNDFINRFRINYFKELALNPSNRHVSLVGLSIESGFNSKSVFNTFFKKVEGVTPSEFLKTLK